MSVRVRLTRVGSKKNPIWRVVVADQRAPRDGRFIETVGQYNPQTEPSTIVIDEQRLQHWLDRGAQPTGTVKKLIKAHAKGPKAGTDSGGGVEEDAAPAPPETSAQEEAGAAAPTSAEAGPPGAETAAAPEAGAEGGDPAAASGSEPETPGAGAGQ